MITPNGIPTYDPGRMPPGIVPPPIGRMPPGQVPPYTRPLVDPRGISMSPRPGLSPNQTSGMQSVLGNIVQYGNPYGSNNPYPVGSTDTVLAKLTPGEGVLNTGAMQIAGRAAVDNLNKMGLQGTVGYQSGTSNVGWDASSPQSNWPDVQLSAPHIDIAALAQKARQNGLSPTAIKSLVQLGMKAMGKGYGTTPYQGYQGTPTLDPTTWTNDSSYGWTPNAIPAYSHGGIVSGWEPGTPISFGGTPSNFTPPGGQGPIGNIEPPALSGTAGPQITPIQDDGVYWGAEPVSMRVPSGHYGMGYLTQGGNPYVLGGSGLPYYGTSPPGGGAFGPTLDSTTWVNYPGVGPVPMAVPANGQNYGGGVNIGAIAGIPSWVLGGYGSGAQGGAAPLVHGL